MKSVSVLQEYKRGIAAGVVIAIFGIAILTVVSGYYFPSEETTTFTSYATNTTGVIVSATNSSSGQLSTWVPTTGYPFAVEAFSCVSSGGYVYCVGGANDTSPTTVVGDMNGTYYASLSGTGVGPWMPTTNYPIGIQDQSCVSSTDYIYCVGGYTGGLDGKNTAAVYYASLSPSGIGPWAPTTPYPNPGGGDCMTDSGYIYCVGPHYNGTAFTSTSDVYFAPLSANGIGNWSESVGFPARTAGCSGSGGYVYCFGGGNCPPAPPPHDCPSPSYFAPLSSNGSGVWNLTSELPTAGFGAYVTADSYEYYFANEVYVAHLSADGIGGWATTTPYPDSGAVASCVADGLYVYCIGGSTNDVYFARIAA